MTLLPAGGAGGFHLRALSAGTVTALCPIPDCRWSFTIDDTPETWTFSVSEADIRRHLDAHTTDDWLRALAAVRRTLPPDRG